MTGMMILALIYPFMAAWMVGARRNRRLKELEHEVAALHEVVDVLKKSPVQERGWEARVTPGQQDLQERIAQEFPTPGVPPHPDTAPPAFGTMRSGRPAPEVQQDANLGQSDFLPEETPSTKADAADLAAALSEGVAPDSVDDVRAAAHGAKPPPDQVPPRWLVAAKNWLLTGNLVTKLGLAILFIGVAFLLKYVAETVLIPIELRLAAVVVADLALLGWGWRLRTTRREIGLPIQGTAIAILMLVIFGAYHRYDLIPAAFAFALLVVLTAFTCLLAVLQNAPWLAAFGITGGFACPLLISAGDGNHVALFSYYALLNAGVFALAIKRAWRPLNLLGFGFTFIVGSAWGGLQYASANYASAQGFLILFFLMYVGIAIAFARQQQTRLKHYVDATLVLGTPLLAFGLQVGLVRDKPFGLALSSLALGGFYLVLALVLIRRSRERWRVLVETFTALGVVFGTLAIPFALDGRWTSATWALEGAGFVWFGLRRAQRATWIFGLLIQIGAWLSFIGAATGLDAAAARNSNLGLGFVLLAGTAFAMARNFRQHAGDAEPVLARIANWSIAIAAIWMLAGTWTEAIVRTSGSTLANLLAAGALLTAAVLYLTGARLAWPQAGRLALAAQLAGALALAVVVATGWVGFGILGPDTDAPLVGVLMIALAALATSRMLDKSPDQTGGARLSAAMLLWGGVWWFGPAIHIGADRMTADLPAILGPFADRWIFLYALGIAASAAACVILSTRLVWPRLRWLGTTSWAMLAFVTLAALGNLYDANRLLSPAAWLSWAVIWAGSEYVLLRWDSSPGPILRAVHALRTAGPWLALWPAGANLVDGWLADASNADQLAAQGHWAISSAWGSYLPTWGMLMVLAWLLKRGSAAKWPTIPLPDWYRSALIPSGALLILLLVAAWNLLHDGTMAPLPYLPLLNPLDLTTGFALALCVSVGRRLALAPGNRGRPRVVGLCVAYAWFNLILLRSAAQYLGIPYQLEDLAASQFVQAMLSLVWSITTLMLMRFAAKRAMRRTWTTGAVLLGVVVVKLVIVDVANGGSVARIVSFVGVGFLMVLIGYLAPYPKLDVNVPTATGST